MNASEELWRQWSGQLRALVPELHGHRSNALAWCVLGVTLAGTTRLPRVAEALVGVSAAKTPSIERRLSRFLANQQVVVLPLWTHLIGQFLRVLAWSTPGLRTRCDDARRACECAVSRTAGPLAPVASELAGAAGPPALGAAAVGGRRRAAGPRHPAPRSRRLHTAGRSRTRRASVGSDVSAARLALRAAVCRLHTPASPQRGRWAQRLDRVSSTWSRGLGGSGMARSSSGRIARSPHKSAPPGSPGRKSPGSSSPTGLPVGSGCASMPAECGSNRRSKISNGVAGTWKGPSLPTAHDWIGCCWCCFWPSGGWRIWRRRASIMASGAGLIAAIAGTRASFGSDASGCSISCGEPSPTRA